MVVGEARGMQKAVRLAYAEERFLWMLALVFFGIGDVATTGAGWQLQYIVEAGPITHTILEQFGLPAMLVLKLVAFTACYEVWRTTPGPISFSVPFSLAALGVFVTTWNLAILYIVIL